MEPFGGNVGKKAVNIVVIDTEAEKAEAESVKAQVYDTLRQMHDDWHRHLPQYVAKVVGPSGLTLREAAAVMGLSHQRVAQLRDKGRKQVSDGAEFDLSWWPMLAPRPTRPNHRAVLERGVVERLRELNEESKRYHRGADPEKALLFYRLVGRLHEAGIPYAVVARTLDEEPKVFRRRLSRWGIGGDQYVTLTVPARNRAKRREQYRRERAKEQAS